MLKRIAKHRRATATAAISTVLALGLGAFALAHDGLETTNVELHDGGVWVTNLGMQHVGHLNVQVEEIDSGFAAQSGNFDVLQDADDVLLHDLESSTLSTIDVNNVETTGGTNIPPAAEVALGGGTVAFVDPTADGALFIMRAGSLGQFNMEEAEPLAELGGVAAVTVDETGRVFALNGTTGEVSLWELGDDPEEPFTRTGGWQRDELKAAESVSITAVGEEFVALNETSWQAVSRRAVVQVPEGAVLQQSGPESDVALAATGSELVRIPWRGGDAAVTEHGSGQRGVAPVQVGGCAYAVFASDNRFVRECDDESRNLNVRYDEEGTEAGRVVLRERRGIVAINRLADGTSWLITEELILVDNWADLLPPESENTEKTEGDSVTDTVTEQPPPERETNTSPVAEDDSIFAARRGASTVLPVLWNDSDADGDLLTVSLVGDAPKGLRISPVLNRSSLQVEVPADFSQSRVSFRYEVSDGRGGTDQATVNLQIRSQDGNEPPRQLREQSFKVEQRASYQYQALDGWFDPDGDQLLLENATTDSGDTVRFNPTGQVVYTATGEPGTTTLTLTVSDGRESTTAEVQVQVLERGQGVPVANADYIELREGERTLVRPLANDYSPSGADLRLGSASPRGDLGIDVDQGAGTILVTAGSVGTHYIDYSVVAGSNSARGFVRVDVLPKSDEGLPIAVRDTLLVPAGGRGVVDLLANDIDPTGGVLVVQSIESESSQVSARLQRRQFLEVIDTQGITKPITITYRVANVAGTAMGEVTVIPVPARTNARPPVAVDDKVVVREGDYATVAVLENDFSPDSVDIHVLEQLVPSFGEEQGYAFVDGDKVRVFMPVGSAGIYNIQYEIADELDQRAAARIHVDVRERDPESNRAPLPESVTARVLAGSEVEIPIPLDGIDPDGDAVELLGVASPPEEGRVSRASPNSFKFESFPTSRGNVTFTYMVRDRWNAVSTARVSVGIAGTADVNQPPFAETDFITVRPGRAIAVNPLLNDSDPDGDNLLLVDNGFPDASPELGEINISGKGSSLLFTAPAEPGRYELPYLVRDTRRAETLGMVVVTVDSEAPLLPPRAIDDFPDATQIQEGVPFVVPVLDNDLDDDGNPQDLQIEVLSGEAAVAGGGIEVTPTDEFQVILYRVTDVDDLTSQAFVHLPPADGILPYLKPDVQSLTVASGRSTSMELADLVVIPTGGKPKIADPARVSATRANGDPLVLGDATLQYTSQTDYIGPATLNVPVVDDQLQDLESPPIAMISIPLNVTPTVGAPPKFHGTVVEVETGASAAPVDLRSLTEDVDPGDVESMEYELVDGGHPDIQFLLEGATVRVSATVDAAPGIESRYRIKLSDSGGHEIEGVVAVRVVSSTRPLAQAVPDATEVFQGRPITVEPLLNDFNPFQNDGIPLRIIDVRPLGGDIKSLNFNERQVEVASTDTFSGRITLQYTVADATTRPERQVVGNITVAVAGIPDVPPRPNIVEVGNRKVTLEWAAPSDNGRPIEHYTVEWNGGSRQCPANFCEIGGLTNGQSYSFTVRATNEVGTSEPSAASVAVVPDVPPAKPGTPQVDGGDGQVRVTWSEPRNEGSPLTGYVLEISVPGRDGQSVRQLGTVTELTWTGLQNGTEYRFRVQAQNSAERPSEWSEWSRVVIPARAPDPVRNLQLAAEPTADGAMLKANWQPGADGGAAIERYTVALMQGGQVVDQRDVRAEANDVSIPVSPGPDPYSVVVTAVNRVGASESVESAPLRVIVPPQAPTLNGVENRDGSSLVSITAGDRRGARVDEVLYYYSLDGGPRQQATWRSGGFLEIQAPNRETPYSVTAYAVTVVDGREYPSEASNTVSIQPQGTPPGLQVRSTQGLDNVVIYWDAPVSNGLPIKSVSVWDSKTQSVREFPANGPGQHTITGLAPDEGVTVTVWANDTSGRKGMEAKIEARALKEPKISISVNSGSHGLSSEMELTWENIPPGEYLVECYAGARSAFSSPTDRIFISEWNGRSLVQDLSTSGNNRLCVIPGQNKLVSFYFEMLDVNEPQLIQDWIYADPV